MSVQKSVDNNSNLCFAACSRLRASSGTDITGPFASAFDCVRGTCPSYFCGICTPLTEVGGRVRLRSAHRGDLCVPSTRTEFGKRSFRVAAPRTWNSLPLHLRSPTISRQQFQSGLKLISSNAPTYDFYLRELLRSELTYLLTFKVT